MAKISHETASTLGRRGGHAKAKAKLTLTKVEETLGPLNDLDDCARWLRQLALWAASGLVPGAVAHATVRAVEIRLRVFESKLDAEVAATLRQRLDELEAQVRRTKMAAS